MTETNSPDSGNLYSLLVQANELKSRADYHGALSLYLKAFEQVGERVDLFVLIAYCHGAICMQEGSDAVCFEAIHWMKRAIALEPTNGHLYADLGEIYHLGILDYEQAAEAFRNALALNPDDLQALRGAAALYGVPEDVVTLEEAIGWTEHALHLDPDPDIHVYLGDLYFGAGRVSEARGEWLKALLCPRPLDLRVSRSVEKRLSTDVKDSL